jgi:hypothetical protein
MSPVMQSIGFPVYKALAGGGLERKKGIAVAISFWW